MTKAKVIRDGATKEEMLKYAETIPGDRKGTGGIPGAGECSDKAGDPRCPSDWVVYDCFWCAASNCVNPRWHTFNCCSCHGQNIF
jgi:hypothetical protein